MCQEASLGPIRELGPAALRTIKAEEVRHLNEQVRVVLVFSVSPYSLVCGCMCLGFHTIIKSGPKLPVLALTCAHVCRYLTGLCQRGA